MYQEYCFSSIDPKNYNKIHLNLPTLTGSKYVNLTITSLTTNCYIKVLRYDDYITINDIKVYMDDDYTRISEASFYTILNAQFQTYQVPVICSVDNCNRLILESENEFIINDLSYNMKILTGMYCGMKFPLKSEEFETINESEEKIIMHHIITPSVGFFLSTPIWYLISNLGNVCFRNEINDIENIQATSICMRIINTMTPAMPIVASNAEFNKTLLVSDISSLKLELVDANLHPIELLCPLYIMINVMDKTQEVENTLSVILQSSNINNES